MLRIRQVFHSLDLKLPSFMEMVDSMYHNYIGRYSLCGMYFMHPTFFGVGATSNLSDLFRLY
jgi:hypothetical protein